MKKKKEYIVLLVVILALVLYLGVRKTDKTHYQLPRLDALAPEKISKIEIQTGGKSLELTKKGDKWLLGPGAYRADAKKVGEMLDLLAALKVTALVSESSSYIRYDLSDDKKIRVRAWEGDLLKRALEIGKVADTYRHTFIRLPQDKSVYQANGSFRRNFEEDLGGLRDKTVLTFDKTRIKEVVIQAEGALLTVTKREFTKGPSDEPAGNRGGKGEKEKPKEEPLWRASGGEKVSEAELNNLLTTLSGLTCERYIEEGKKGNFGAPLFTVRLKGAREILLSIFQREKEDGDEYPSTSSENPYPFALSKWTVDKLLKSPAMILEKEGKS